jgi:hypothetical protein
MQPASCHTRFKQGVNKGLTRLNQGSGLVNPWCVALVKPAQTLTDYNLLHKKRGLVFNQASP